MRTRNGMLRDRAAEARSFSPRAAVRRPLRWPWLRPWIGDRIPGGDRRPSRSRRISNCRALSSWARPRSRPSTTSGSVRSRGSATTRSRKNRCCPRGTALYVLDGPVTASGYDWYNVAQLTSRTLPSGWVASTSRDGEPWIVARCVRLSTGAERLPFAGGPAGGRRAGLLPAGADHGPGPPDLVRV